MYPWINDGRTLHYAHIGENNIPFHTIVTISLYIAHELIANFTAGTSVALTRDITVRQVLTLAGGMGGRT
ncbi:MAG: hypothetical protein GY832_35320 [Chloroflexi bacterium]|nr:hypothetical protein [Chloroflexota bacterium]